MNENTQGTDGGPKAMTLLDATASLLSTAPGPMRCKDIVEAVIARGLWSPGKGKTPDRTLCAALQREMKKGEGSRFVKAGPGQFTLKVAESDAE